MPRRFASNSTLKPTPRPQSELAEFFGFSAEPTLNYPRHNSSLTAKGSVVSPELRSDLGITAQEIIAEPASIKIKSFPQGEVWRTSERVDAPNLPSLQELSELNVDGSANDRQVKLNGDLPVIAKSVLLVGDERHRQAVVFRSSPYRFIKGESGAASPLDKLPSQVFSEQANDYFMVGSKGKEEVIITSQQAGSTELERQIAVEGARKRIVSELQQLREKLLDSPEKNRKAVGDLNRRIEYFLKPRKIVSLPNDLVDLGDQAIDIEYSIGEQTERFKGFVSLNSQDQTVTIAKPISINPASMGIDPTTIKYFDGTGLNRQLKTVTELKSGQSFDVRSALAMANRPNLVQDESLMVSLEPPVDTTLYRNPFELIPNFNP